MSSRRRAATTIAGVVLAVGLAGCGDDKAQQTDSGSTTGSTSTQTTTGTATTTSTSAPAASMDPGMDHSKTGGMENMPGMNHPAAEHP
jgi:hypothetical protein